MLRLVLEINAGGEVEVRLEVDGKVMSNWKSALACGVTSLEESFPKLLGQRMWLSRYKVELEAGVVR